MIRQINIHEAKTHLSHLVEYAARGEEIVIAKAGKPMARLVGIDAARQPRLRGLLKGHIRIGADFDAPLPEEVLGCWITRLTARRQHAATAPAAAADRSM